MSQSSAAHVPPPHRRVDVDEESYCEPHVYRGVGDILGDVPAVAPPPALKKQAAFGDTQSLWVY